jgi:hypothetical protein
MPRTPSISPAIHTRLARWCTVALSLAAWEARHAHADVIVIANRMATAIQFQFQPAAGETQVISLPSGETMPLFLDGRASVLFNSQGGAKRYQLDVNSAYYFGRGAGGRVDLQKIGLGEDRFTIAGRSLPGSASRAPIAVIPVKAFVDEEEPSRQAYWERRVRRRIESASEILEKHCRVSFRVTAVGTWNSDNQTTDFTTSLGEFEREASSEPAQLAIGFTSQWALVKGRTHMAGTRGPLHSHILVREGSPHIAEPEKLEFLVHEMGHYLGASHSPERTSVMRPVLGDNLAGSAGFHIRFDPVNTLVMSLLGEEIRRRNVKQLSELTSDTRRRLEQIYLQLSRSMPDDPAGMHYVQLMRSATTTPMAGPAKHVLQAIVRAAISNHALPLGIDMGSGIPSRRTGDALTEYYVRQAARTADGLADEVAARAFLAALGVAMDDSDMLGKIPGVGGLHRAIEAPNERVVRQSVIGEPTMRGRQDLAKHFFLSAYLTATMGADAANAAGVAKELVDVNTTSGLSFADLAADRAGVKFAEGVLTGRFPLHLIAQGFAVSAFVPEVKDLPEGISSADLMSQYGSADDPRFRKLLDEIDQQIRLLPPHRMTPGGFRP